MVRPSSSPQPLPQHLPLQQLLDTQACFHLLAQWQTNPLSVTVEVPAIHLYHLHTGPRSTRCLKQCTECSTNNRDNSNIINNNSSNSSSSNNSLSWLNRLKRLLQLLEDHLSS